MTIALFSDLDTIDSAINFLNGQKTNVTNNYPDGDIKTAVLAELNAEIAFYTGLQSAEISSLSSLLGISGGAASLIKATINVAQVAAAGGVPTTDIVFGALPPNTRVLASWIRMTVGFNDGLGHGYTLNANISDGVGGGQFASQTVSATGTLRNSFSVNTNQGGIVNDSSATDLVCHFDYGGNHLDTLTVGQVAVSVLIAPME